MQQWLEYNFTSVLAMYEDRYLLWGFTQQGRLIRRSLPARRAQAWPLLCSWSALKRCPDLALRKQLFPGFTSTHDNGNKFLNV
jgi:hypothetical protein